MNKNEHAWSERTVKRYFWNGKGYHSRTAVCRAIAKKEAVVWCATHFASLFPDHLANTIRTNSTGDYRSNVSWITALAFANIGSNGDHFYYGNHLFAVSPWQDWVSRRVLHLLTGDSPMIDVVESCDDRFAKSWAFKSTGLAVASRLPLADHAHNQAKFVSPSEIVDALEAMYVEYEERYPNMSCYEGFPDLCSPLDILLAKLENPEPADSGL